MALRLIRKRDYVPEQVYQRRWWILAVLCLALFIVMIDNTVLNVALPTLSRELHATSSQLQWMVDAYSLIFAGLLFTAGAVGDRYGRKGIFQAGLLLFGLTSAYTAFIASSATAVIFARGAMGLAGAMIMPATLSILTNVFPPKERAKAVGIWSGIVGVGVAVGPVLGGFLLDHFSWHSVFTINIPIVIVCLIAAAFIVPRTADPSHASLDPLGGFLSTVGLVALVYAIIEAPNKGWLAASTLLIGSMAVLILALFYWWQLRAKHPMLDVRLFKNKAFGISAFSIGLVFFSLYGIFFSFSLFLQLIHGYSPLEAAIRMLPIAGVLAFAAPLSTVLAKRLGKRRIVGSGMLLVALGVLIFSTVGITSSYLHLLAGMLVMAFGMGLAMSPTTDLLMSSVPKNRAGMGSAMNDTARELGGALGVAVLGSLLASQYTRQISGALTALPATAKQVAEGSLAGAMGVAQQIGGTAGHEVLVAAQNAWMSGFHRSLVIGAAIITVAAIVAFRGLPDIAQDVIPEEGYFEEDEEAEQKKPAKATATD
ncbi:MAG TPA: DHA2 family efflux MFS transporter permease subunit [Candidatus Saccharimonadales bacterium]|nr:DHA2 family efflux MFS transporter permease subunit [Candidatus Saccharimonadales bacterium]